MAESPAEQRREDALALGERLLADVLALREEDVEDEVRARLVLAGFHRVLQALKVAHSVLAEHHQLAVEDRAL